nr:phasin family protein [Myxococcus hansupus]
MKTETEATQNEVQSSEAAAKSGLAQNVESFLKTQLAQAQKRIEELEGEAGKVVKTLESRGQEAAKEAQALWTKLQAGELLTDPRVQELRARANAASTELTQRVDAAGTEIRKRFDGIQTRVVEAVGVASQAQLKDLNKELAKLSRKVDSLLKPVRRVNGAKSAASSPASSPRA